MGLSIRPVLPGRLTDDSIPETGPLEPLPCPIELELECDEVSDIFCRGFATYSHPDGYMGAHAAAMKDGWLERHTDGGCVWLCPRCSGK